MAVQVEARKKARFRVGPLCTSPSSAHMHDPVEIAIVRRGHVNITVNGTAYAMGPNTAMIIFPGMIHSYNNTSEDAAGLFVGFTPDVINEFRNALINMWPVVPMLKISNCPAETEKAMLDYPIIRADETELRPEDVERAKQYSYRYAENEEEYEQLLEDWRALNLNGLTNYNVYDPADTDKTEKTGVRKANELLDKAGWTLNRDGKEYRPGEDDVRCKVIDDQLIALDLTMMYPKGNHIVDTIQENFLDNLAEAGIKVTLVPEDMEELLKSYYREKDRTTDMIYLGTDFHVIVDPSITYSTDPTPNHLIWNNTYSDDEELWELAVDMRKTVPENYYEYIVKWIRFQERYNEVLPAIPLYSNIYFDFFTDQLQNYEITAHVTWSQAILQSYFGEPLPEPEEDKDGEISDEALADRPGE